MDTIMTIRDEQVVTQEICLEQEIDTAIDKTEKQM